MSSLAHKKLSRDGRFICEYCFIIAKRLAEITIVSFVESLTEVRSE